MFKYSILSAAHNSDRYVETYVASILRQKVYPEKVIIVDDLNNLKLSFIKKKLSRKKITVIIIKNKKNIGPGKSLNKGLKLLKDKIVFRLDMDDIWLKNHVQIMSENIISYPENFLYANNISTHNFFNKLRLDNFYINENPLIHSSWVLNMKNFKNFVYKNTFPALAVEDYCSIYNIIKKNKKIFSIFEKTVLYIPQEYSHGKMYRYNTKRVLLIKKISKLILNYHLEFFYPNKPRLYQLYNFLTYKLGYWKYAIYLLWTQDLLHLKKLYYLCRFR